jgi:hypothetical protein
VTRSIRGVIAFPSDGRVQGIRKRRKHSFGDAAECRYHYLLYTSLTGLG